MCIRDRYQRRVHGEYNQQLKPGLNSKMAAIERAIHGFWNYLNEMDFPSQKLCEKLYQTIIITVALISFVFAFIYQRFAICVASTMASAALCIVLFVPGWPCWKRKPVKWLKPKQKQTR
eukprot:TRINITY_DN935_c0_g1_i4.p3 TRINITY_DN935_c0_g1~~TRINITY_DN935_c0_g1_i4.p3  ORF type:complete len:119 (-),score=28.59 TRINITY_DN935_c0_g1_i4:304-660(-)